MNTNVAPNCYSIALQLTDRFELFILEDDRKYYFFIQFIVGPLIAFVITLSLKNMRLNTFFIIPNVPGEFIKTTNFLEHYEHIRT